MGDRFRRVYRGGFKKHLLDAKKEIFDDARTDGGKLPLLMPCLNDNERFQFNFISVEQLIQKLKGIDIEEEERIKLCKMYENTFMDLPEIREALKADCPDFDTFVDLWNSTPLKSLTLTSIGIAIAHSNLRHQTGFSADLSIWID